MELQALKHETVKLFLDSNAFAIMSRMSASLGIAQVDKSVFEVYVKEATASDYENLCAVTRAYEAKYITSIIAEEQA
jgi:hypothetical protein